MNEEALIWTAFASIISVGALCSGIGIDWVELPYDKNSIKTKLIFSIGISTGALSVLLAIIAAHFGPEVSMSNTLNAMGLIFFILHLIISVVIHGYVAYINDIYDSKLDEEEKYRKILDGILNDNDVTDKNLKEKYLT